MINYNHLLFLIIIESTKIYIQYFTPHWLSLASLEMASRSSYIWHQAGYVIRQNVLEHRTSGT